MRSRNIGIYLLTILFLCTAGFWFREDRGEGPFYFLAETGAGTEEIRYHTQYDGSCLVVIPGDAALSDLKIRTGEALWIGEEKFTYGKTCEELQLGVSYDLAGPEGTPTAITFLQTGDLPTVYIDTVSESMDYIHSMKGNREAAQMRLYHRGALAYAGSLESIQARGNSSFYKEKKQYSIRLSGTESLLEMGSAREWILAANSFDPTHLRNKLVYDFAAQVGLPYSPESRWVDLYLNGEYAGLYLLTERNEIHPERVDIPRQGSSLMSMEFGERLAAENRPYLQTSRGTALRIHDSSVDPEELAQRIQSVEDAIYAQDGVDPRTGKHFSELIDLDSWARKYLIEEIFGNVDGGRASQFCYLDGSDPAGKLYAGPVWDYDLALSNPATYSENGAPETYRDTYFGMFLGNFNQDTWFYPLYRNEMFQTKVKELYARDFKPALEALLNGTLDGYAAEIAQSARANEALWQERDVQAETAYLRACIEGRMEFLDRVWMENWDYVTVEAHQIGRTVGYALSPGEKLPPLPQYQGGQWLYTETDQPVDPERPIEEDTKIYAKPAPLAAAPEVIPEPEPEAEDVSILRFGPFVVLVGLLAGLCTLDFRRAGKNRTTANDQKVISKNER